MNFSTFSKTGEFTQNCLVVYSNGWYHWQSEIVDVAFRSVPFPQLTKNCSSVQYACQNPNVNIL